MEKRTILAFVLAFLVLIVWSYLYAPKQKQTIPRQKDIHEERKIVTPESAKKPVFKPSVPTDIPSQIIKDKSAAYVTQKKEIKVETPLYRVIFSNEGATIRSFQLKEYRTTTDPDSPPVELVNLGADEGKFFSVGFDNQTALGDGEYVYSVNEDSVYLSAGSGPKDLTFRYLDSDGVSIDETYRFYPDKYDIDLFITLRNDSELPADGNIKAYLSNLPPKNKSSYYSFVGVALLLNDKLVKIKPKKMKDNEHLSGQIGWMAYENDYFMSAIIPEGQIEGSFMGTLMPSGAINSVYISPSITLRPFEQVSSRFILYMGPRDLDILKKFGKGLDRAINFGFFDIIAKPLHFALRFFYRYVHNYGVSIIIITLLIKILFWPLTHKSYKSMKEMQKLQPLMAKIREKYKDNREQMQRELMGLYKTYKVNPMGGCLPMLIQIPVFFALFRILGNSIELRHAPFMLWITDLSAPDRLFNFPFSIPFMSPPYGIPVLTLLMGASMFIQQKMQPMPGDPAQAKVMMFLPIIFTVMFINFPSGLVLYWLTNNILSIGQQYRIKKRPG